MAKPKTNAEGLALVFTKVSRPELARQLELSRQFIHKWREVPMKYLIKVERISNVPREHILPEIFR